jgi:hypothetical protein
VVQSWCSRSVCVTAIADPATGAIGEQIGDHPAPTAARTAGTTSSRVRGQRVLVPRGAQRDVDIGRAGRDKRDKLFDRLLRGAEEGAAGDAFERRAPLIPQRVLGAASTGLFRGEVEQDVDGAADRGRSRSTRSHAASTARPSSAKRSGDTYAAFQPSPCRATRGSVVFGPTPPIQTGRRARTGRGSFRAMRGCRLRAGATPRHL